MAIQQRRYWRQLNQQVKLKKGRSRIHKPYYTALFQLPGHLAIYRCAQGVEATCTSARHHQRAINNQYHPYVMQSNDSRREP